MASVTIRHLTVTQYVEVIHSFTVIHADVIVVFHATTMDVGLHVGLRRYATAISI